jgi:N-acetylmuramoyl-L-alanine amidase
MLRNGSRNTILILLLVMTLGCFGQKSSYTIKKIVIDPGHGGKDPGATVGKSYEKDIALDVALKTGKLIKKMYPEVEVIYTRDKDVFIPLNDRPELANKQKADLFMSIHVNICSTLPTTGVETFILGLRRSAENQDVVKLENSVIVLEDDYNKRYEGFDPNSPESYVMFELMQNEFLEQSRLLADMVQNHFVSHAKRKNRGVRQDCFLVLRKNAMPSVLIELGFLSNKGEREFMEKEQGKNLLAESIAKAFSEYKIRFDQNGKVESPVTEVEIEPDSIPVENDSLNDILKLDGKWYGTQILAIRNKLKFNDKIFKNQKPIYFLLENGFYKYFVGLTQDSQEATNLYKGYKAIYKDPFLVSFENGEKKKFK